MRKIALAAIVMLLAGCAAKQHPASLEPVMIGKTTEAEIATRMGPPLKSVTAPNGAKNDTYRFEMLMAADPVNGPNATTYIFGPDGVLRHIIMENGSGARFLLHEANTDGVLPDEIVGPMPTVVEVTIKRVQ